MSNLKKGHKSKNKPSKAAKNKVAEAIHLEHEDGVHHIVGLGNIRVLLLPDGDGFFAQGLEIDYGAQGDTLEEAKKEFEEGLEALVQEHLRVYGGIKALLQVAPNDIWSLGSDPKAQWKRYSQVTHHHAIRDNTNFKGIDYLVAANAA